MIFLATAAFGLEGVVKRELLQLGLDAKAELGAVRFEASLAQALNANLWLRTADRVLLLLAEGTATSFEDLFQLVSAIRWQDYLPRDAAFPVSGKCARSQLMSVRDCQAITKKAIAEQMKKIYRTTWCEESGATYAVDVSLHADTARITLDTSGVALNRRGYRTWNGEAPLRETLAAALVSLSPWRQNTPLHDPCCGTGTLLIEAAFIQGRRAPGINRSFAMESWTMADRRAFEDVRAAAAARFDASLIQDISGSDIDPEALSLCKKHIAQAGLGSKITVFEKDLRDLTLPQQNICFIANPPYGERMSDRATCEKLYRDLRGLRSRHPGSRLCVITSHSGFERCYGARATQKRRLYNGRLESEYLIY